MTRQFASNEMVARAHTQIFGEQWATNRQYGEVRIWAIARAWDRVFPQSNWRKIISSLLNKVCINSSTIGRHGGGELMIEFYIGARVVLETVSAHRSPSRWTLPCQGIKLLPSYY